MCIFQHLNRCLASRMHLLKLPKKASNYIYPIYAASVIIIGIIYLFNFHCAETKMTKLVFTAALSIPRWMAKF